MNVKIISADSIFYIPVPRIISSCPVSVSPFFKMFCFLNAMFEIQRHFFSFFFFPHSITVFRRNLGKIKRNEKKMKIWLNYYVYKALVLNWASLLCTCSVWEFHTKDWYGWFSLLDVNPDKDLNSLPIQPLLVKKDPFVLESFWTGIFNVLLPAL